MGCTVRIIPCPICKKRIAYTDKNPYRPFCSEKCKMVDLGRWLIETYRIKDPDFQDSIEDNDNKE
ncbi:MAG: DNA gyrase inhibitor YacG [Desulfobacterota bacterium]|nr:DNA gyrase inhibitor YacG [Thermodesulfobacteriota bacterium]